jgi:His/Glu/Gln/Arg/opine family amino acid ABC transporter permease subunit
MDSLPLGAIVTALLSGACVTIEVTAGALTMALLIGLGLAIITYLNSSRLVALLVRAYVEALRNVPSLTFLFLLYFGLAALGLRLSSMCAAIVGLGMIGGAIAVDIFCSGLQSVPSGQSEAAAAVGLTPFKAFHLIILPQGLRLALPSLGNYAVGLVKDTSLVAAVAAPEVMFNARQLVNETFQTAAIYGAAAILYLIFTMVVTLTVSLIERRLEIA